MHHKKNLLILAIALWNHLNHTIGSLPTLEHFQGTAFNIGLVRGHIISCGFKNLKITNSRLK
jgi:hypothetical protein